MAYFRVNERCNGCLACVQNCPATALSYKDLDQKRTLRHNMAACARCGQCWRVCPQEAIEFQYLLNGSWEEVVTLELVRCEVCGEPLYTSHFRQTVASRYRGEIESFCSRHRREVDRLAQAHFTPGPSIGERR